MKHSFPVSTDNKTLLRILFRILQQKVEETAIVKQHTIKLI